MEAELAELVEDDTAADGLADLPDVPGEAVRELDAQRTDRPAVAVRQDEVFASDREPGVGLNGRGASSDNRWRVCGDDRCAVHALG